MDFVSPSLKFYPQPLYFWNDSVIADSLASQMQALHEKSGYGGFGILSFGKDFKPEYLSEKYFSIYGTALSKAKDLGLSMCLYDEFGFPSGSAGAINADGNARFKNKYPDKTLKRLDMKEETVSGPATIYWRLPAGKLMAVVGMDTVTHIRYDLMSGVYANRLKWHVPNGSWKLMFFYLVEDSDPIVDYLDPEAVRCFINMTHQAYYNHFKNYFGKTIIRSFFDEPTMYRAKGRIWTGNFNDQFQKKYGFSAAKLYPALWHDIGPETQAARNYMFGLRTELYAKGFTKEVNDWSLAHGILATGHQDQEEVANPVSVSGDLMKCFQYLSIPGIDKIGGDRPAERFYKVVSSAANNWDKPYVMSETYGAMENISWDTIYSIAMEQYTKGINMLIPHAAWYNINKVAFQPELSYRNPHYADSLPVFNKYLSRLNVMLQAPARHVADIAVLYPIQTLQGEHYLDGPLDPYYGGVVIPKTDYVDVSNYLIDSLGMDFTFVHPEVLDGKCVVKDSLLLLTNKMNPETYKVLVLPGIKTISLTNLQKIKNFYDQGGKIIFTTQLPCKSAEYAHDGEVKNSMKAIFPVLSDPAIADVDLFAENAKGGKALFVKSPDANAIRNAIDSLHENWDVVFEESKRLNYIHKVRDEHNIYFFANPGKSQVDGIVKLRGKMKLEIWNPHTGQISKPDLQYEEHQGEVYTVLALPVRPTSSLFLVERELKDLLDFDF